MLKDSEPHHAWALRAFEAPQGRGPVVICDIVYSEWSVGMATQADVDAAAGRLPWSDTRGTTRPCSGRGRRSSPTGGTTVS